MAKSAPEKQSLSIHVSERIGTVSAELIHPANAFAIMTLAHGAGAGMQHPFLVQLAEALAQEGIATLRFNFPFTEQKKKRPDFPPVAQATIAAAAEEVRLRVPDLPLYVSGKSFGGRMSSQWLAASPQPNVRGIIFFGFPLHAAGKPSSDRAEHLRSLQLPLLFLQGTKDTLADWSLITQLTKELPTATLEKFDGADHSFKCGRENLIPVLAQRVHHWMKSKH